MSDSARERQSGDPSPNRSSGRQSAGRWLRRHFRRTGTAVTALAGLTLLLLGPTVVALAGQTYANRGDKQPANWQPMGSEVRDGTVTFVVHTVRCGTAEPDRAVHGRLCELTLGARNDGPEPVTVPGGAQYLAGPEGIRHLPVTGDPEPFGTMAPGAAATATITFDLPPNAVLTHVRLHADPYTDGRAIALEGPPLPLLSIGDPNW